MLVPSSLKPLICSFLVVHALELIRINDITQNSLSIFLLACVAFSLKKVL